MINYIINTKFHPPNLLVPLNIVIIELVQGLLLCLMVVYLAVDYDVT